MAIFKLPDGRELAWTTYGDADGAPLFYLHGGGSSRLEPAYAEVYARRLRLRLIAVDRPGYGQSTRSPAPGFVAFAHDLLALADALELPRFGVIGMSAGAPHALHAAALAPERVRLVALINGSSDSRHPASKTMPLSMRLLTKIAAAPPLLRRFVGRLKSDPAGFTAGAARREQWNEEAIAQFVAAVGEGMRQDAAVETMVGEAQRVLRQPWGLDWGLLRCPVLVLCGEGDPGRWFYREMARRLPNLKFVPIPGGHQPRVGEAAWGHIARALD